METSSSNSIIFCETPRQFSWLDYAGSQGRGFHSQFIFTMGSRQRRYHPNHLHIRQESHGFESTLTNISDEILDKELEKMLFLLSGVIPGRKRQSINEAYKVFAYLKERGLIHENNVTYLVNLLKDIKREDLAKRLKHHNAHQVKSYKCIFVGDSSCGKTALMLRLMYNSFPDDYRVTISPDCLKRSIYLQEKFVHVEMWDTAGMEALNNFLPNQFFRDVSVVIIVFDITEIESFESTARWRNEVKFRSPNAVILLIGNKLDLGKERVVSSRMGERRAAEFGAEYVEVSAKDGQNTDAILTAIAKALPPDPPLSEDLATTSTDAGTQTPAETQISLRGFHWRAPARRRRPCHC